MLSSYGTNNIIIMLLLAIVLISAGICFFDNKILAVLLFVLGGVLFLFTLWFFRDPERTIPEKSREDEALLLSPADGRIVEIVQEEEKHYLKDASIRISIFLSPLDVHVNRSPVTGVVEFYNYNPGKYLVASYPKSSELNEQSHIGVKNKYGKVFFKQIVGIVARRLVCELKVGDKVNSGDKIGMMKFGSRMDIAVSPVTEIFVKVGDKVIAGETIIAKLKKN